VPDTVIRHADFVSQQVIPRHVDVWLPAECAAEPARRFPVLYMHDGQNLFDPATSSIGVAWEVDRAARRLIDAGVIPPPIIVGVWCTERRWQEYMPQRPLRDYAGDMNVGDSQFRLAEIDPRLAGGLLSDAYLRFLVGELKPFIDQTYPTRPEREQTFIMGSSMGGLISLYALCSYPDLFAAAGCVSTHWPAAAGATGAHLPTLLPPPGRHKLYFDYGTATLDAEYEPHQQQVDQIMQTAGYTPGQDWLTRKFEGADHSERAWRARVHIPLAFMLGANR